MVTEQEARDAIEALPPGFLETAPPGYSADNPWRLALRADAACDFLFGHGFRADERWEESDD